jgi:hypothetical protein
MAQVLIQEVRPGAYEVEEEEGGAVLINIPEGFVEVWNCPYHSAMDKQAMEMLLVELAEYSTRDIAFLYSDDDEYMSVAVRSK